MVAINTEFLVVSLVNTAPESPTKVVTLICKDLSGYVWVWKPLFSSQHSAVILALRVTIIPVVISKDEILLEDLELFLGFGAFYMSFEDPENLKANQS